MYLKPYYMDQQTILILHDSFDFMSHMKPQTMDMIFADPPYFLSNGGISTSGGKIVCVNKGKWDHVASFKEKHNFNLQWIKLAKKILKPNGTIWISGSMHNIYSVGVALEQNNFKIMNNITWQKTSPPRNLTKKYFTHSTETILWARKKSAHSHCFNYQQMCLLNNGQQMTDVWPIAAVPKIEKTFGYHPTQKPEFLLRQIVLASTNPGDYILDPFMGSGTTGVIAKKLGRQFIGIDQEKQYVNLAYRRIINTKKIESK
ncbi:MAG: site-specific DNA-methyltransferase [Lactobacillus sp.]|uniref:DNA-methyltransferase n=2 Tax=Bombilactobacillus bombi TaxID=1303590 RepID=UPI0035E7FA93|nr:site-specific DNA-methyltransferase [Lactobacillus sp.]